MLCKFRSNVFFSHYTSLCTFNVPTKE
jgi:hypothetical protein